MKRLITAFAACAALLSCTQQYIPKETDYYVEDAGTCLFMASVQKLSGIWTWDAVRSKVGVYAGESDNILFVPRASFDGATGTAQLMGPPVTGKAYAYIPYRNAGVDAVKAGCVPLTPEQAYYDNAVAQIEGNSILVAAADEDGHLAFRYLCGALHLKVKINFTEPVQRVSLTANEPLCGWLDINGIDPMRKESYTVSVVGIDKPCSESTPLDVWIMLPEGTYSGLYMTAAGATQSVSTIVSGSFDVVAGQEVSATAQEKKNNYDGSDFDAEEVDYD